MQLRGMVLAPEEVALVQRVFHDIAAEPWFPAAKDKRDEFAYAVLKSYKQGLTVENILRRYCRIVAVQRYTDASSSLPTLGIPTEHSTATC
jgi:hypothetical protein